MTDTNNPGSGDIGLGIKHDHGKRRWSLLPMEALEPVVRVLEFGARKYSVDNWMCVPEPTTRYYDALQRHLVAWRSGESFDPESGEHHLAHAGCCLVFLLWFVTRSGEGRIPEEFLKACRDAPSIVDVLEDPNGPAAQPLFPLMAFPNVSFPELREAWRRVGAAVDRDAELWKLETIVAEVERTEEKLGLVNGRIGSVPSDTIEHFIELLDAALTDHERALRAETQLAGCGVAARGHGEAAKPGDYGWSASYQDVLNLRTQRDMLAFRVTEISVKLARAGIPSVGSGTGGPVTSLEERLDVLVKDRDKWRDAEAGAVEMHLKAAADALSLRQENDDLRSRLAHTEAARHELRKRLDDRIMRPIGLSNAAVRQSSDWFASRLHDTVARVYPRLMRHAERYVKAWTAATGTRPEDAVLTWTYGPDDSFLLRVTKAEPKR